MPNPKGNPQNLTAGRFKPGQSGNPTGNAGSLRQKLTADFLKEMKNDFEKHGRQAIVECREKKPDVYVKVVATFLPKEIKVSSPLEELTYDDLIAAITALRSSAIAQGIGSGAGEEKVLQ